MSKQVPPKAFTAYRAHPLRRDQSPYVAIPLAYKG